MKAVLIDTNVFIDYLSGTKAALDFIDQLTVQPATSVVVVAELYSGVRDGHERSDLERLLRYTTIHPLTHTIAVEGGLMRRRFGPSHNVALDDALIAATAVQIGATLVTLKQQTFPDADRSFGPLRAVGC